MEKSRQQKNPWTEFMHEKTHDRRRHFRFNAEAGSLRIVHSGNNETLGELLNISHEGIAYRYTTDVEQPDNGFQFNLFRVGSRAFLLNGVISEKVYDFDASEVFQVESGKYRICGIKFAYIREEQTYQIETCIRKHTLIKKYLH